METHDPWKHSLFFYFTDTWQLVAFHAAFLFCCAAFRLGWRTSWVKWIVLVGHISYDYRNPSLTYGVDKILACLLFILCLAPIGKRVQPRSCARLAQRQAPQRTSTAEPADLQRPLGRRLHTANADPDGDTVLLQRRQQACAATTGGPATRCGPCSPPTSTTIASRSISWPRNTGWLMSRLTARSWSNSPMCS